MKHIKSFRPLKNFVCKKREIHGQNTDFQGLEKSVVNFKLSSTSRTCTNTVVLFDEIKVDQLTTAKMGINTALRQHDHMLYGGEGATHGRDERCEQQAGG